MNSVQLPWFQIVFLQAMMLVHHALSSGPSTNPTKGFVALPFNASYYHIQRPYNKPVSQRYLFEDGIHKLWVFADDKPHTPTTRTKPSTEIAIQSYGYSSGVWQFDGHGYVPRGTSGMCIMQVFGATHPHASTFMLQTYNGTLMYYRDIVLARNMYNRRFKLNVIHDVSESKVNIYINDRLKLEAGGRGGNSHAFKCGVYAQADDSSYMESRWKYIKILKKM